MTPEENSRITSAVEQWFTVLDSQGKGSKNPQEGRRSQVTAGRHMEGLNQLIIAEIKSTGASDLDIRNDRQAVLAGYYRNSKAWDLLVFQHGDPILAIEYKSMGSSVGNNLNNRADEVFGMAEDAREAEKHGILPPNLRRAYIYLLEVTPAVNKPVRVGTRYGIPDVIFNDASYFDRVTIMCERMRDSGLYHLVWAFGATRSPLGFIEPNPAVGWDRFAADLRAGFQDGTAVNAPHP